MDTIKKVGLVAELNRCLLRLEEDLNPLAKIGVTARIAALVAMLSGDADVPEVAPGSDVEPKPEAFEGWVNDRQLSMVQAKINDLNKKAEKLGVGGLTLEIKGTRSARVVSWTEHTSKAVHTYFKAVQDNHRLASGEELMPWSVKQTFIIVGGESPKLAGWRFSAKLEHLKTGNLVRTFPGGGQIPDRYLTSPSLCEHCGTTRNRNFTYVVAHDDGKHMQVGSACLKDFLGHADAERIAGLAAFRSQFWEYLELLEEEPLGEGDSASVAAIGFPSVSFLEAVAALVRRDGYQKADDYGTPSTGRQAWELLMKGGDIGITEPDRAKASAALGWVTALDDEAARVSQYLWNLKTAAAEDHVGLQQAGILGSLIPAYDRAMAKKADDEVESNWIGQVAKRIELDGVRVVGKTSSDGAYGTTWIYQLRDSDGNRLTWFASRPKLKDGVIYKIKATIKKHDLFRGSKVTVLTRVDVISESVMDSVEDEYA